MGAISETSYITKAGWDDVPHIPDEEKEHLKRVTPPHLLPARMHGEPVAEVGRIYPWDFSKIAVDPVHLDPRWPRIYGFDPSASRVGALWGALDEQNDIVYLYGEYHQEHHVPTLHATSILTRGKWIPGIYDPSAEIKGLDGKKMIQVYRAAGMKNLSLAENAVTAGIQAVVDRVVTGRLKAFSTLGRLRFEWNNYRRNEKQAIIKKNDDLVDCLRYICFGGLVKAQVNPQYLKQFTGMPSGSVGDTLAGF